VKLKHFLIIGIVVVAILAVRQLGCRSPSRGEAAVLLNPGGWVSGDQIKTPLQAGLEVQQQGRTLMFLLRLRDAAGTQIRGIRLPGGLPKEPTVTVFNAAGDRVYNCRLKYG